MHSPSESNSHHRPSSSPSSIHEFLPTIHNLRRSVYTHISLSSNLLLLVFGQQAYVVCLYLVSQSQLILSTPLLAINHSSYLTELSTLVYTPLLRLSTLCSSLVASTRGSTPSRLLPASFSAPSIHPFPRYGLFFVYWCPYAHNHELR